MANVPTIEVVYAKADKQWIIELPFEINMTVIEAIHQSKILERLPEIDLNKNKTGIYGEICELSTILKANDRVEIYRSLLLDPQSKRFQKVFQERKKFRREKYGENKSLP